MRVDFYQLSRDPVERMVLLIARKVFDMGDRLLVVAGETSRLDAIEKALWADGPGRFLANGRTTDQSGDQSNVDYAERQPILLSDQCDPKNGAHIAIFADGQWREEAAGLDRVLLAFGPDQTEAARELWRKFTPDENIEQRIFKQGDDGNWREGG